MLMGIIESILQNRGRATIYACDDPVKTLAVGLDGKIVNLFNIISLICNEGTIVYRKKAIGLA